MRLKISQFFYFSLFVFIFIMSGMIPIMSRAYALETNTTLYLGSVEKTLETGESKVYYNIGSTTVVRSIKPDNTSTVSYLHSDHLGSTILITNNEGNVEGPTLAYYPYGNLTSDTKQLTIDKLYTGQKRDTSSDLYFYNARYYNSNTSHFISADSPAGGQGPNHYAYVGNNPIMRNDPSGNMAEQGGGGGYNYDAGEVMAKYSNQIAFGAMAQMLADLRIPLISDLAGEYSLGIQQFIRGELTNNTMLQTQGFTHGLNSAVGAYMLGAIVIEAAPVAVPVVGAGLVAGAARIADKPFSRFGLLGRVMGTNKDLISIAKMSKISPEAAEWDMREFIDSRGITLNKLPSSYFSGGADGFAVTSMNRIDMLRLEDIKAGGRFSLSGALQRQTIIISHETSHLIDRQYCCFHESFRGELRAYALGSVAGYKTPISSSLWSSTYWTAQNAPESFMGWLHYNVSN